MLRESDNSMMAILPSNPFPRLGVNSTALPDFQASTSGNSTLMTASGSEIDAVKVRQELNGGKSLRPAADAVVSAGIEHLSAGDRAVLETGLRQRFEAVSACLDEVVRLQRIPAFFQQSTALALQLRAILNPVAGTQRVDAAWTWFGSVDVFRSASGDMTVLDQNFSLPSGLEFTSPDDNASAASRFLFSNSPGYSSSLKSSATVVLDPDFRGATFRGNEFLARCLNAHMARRTDLCVSSQGVTLRLGSQTIPVQTIVRRVDDELLDPNCYRPESLVGLPGLVNAWKKGLVQVVSPPGVQVANTRSFGKLIPEMIREFLGEEPLLDSVEILELGDDDNLRHVLKNIEDYAIRTVDPQHPARPFFGRFGHAADFSDLLKRIHLNPKGYIARRLLPQDEKSGTNLRLFATTSDKFRLHPVALRRPVQPDGGAPAQYFKS